MTLRSITSLVYIRRRLRHGWWRRLLKKVFPSSTTPSCTGRYGLKNTLKPKQNMSRRSSLETIPKSLVVESPGTSTNSSYSLASGPSPSRTSSPTSSNRNSPSRTSSSSTTTTGISATAGLATCLNRFVYTS